MVEMQRNLIAKKHNSSAAAAKNDFTDFAKAYLETLWRAVDVSGSPAIIPLFSIGCEGT